MSTGDEMLLESRLKILCVHGYRQNGDALKSKLGSFRKFVKRYATFVFVSAPHQAPPIKPEDSINPEHKSWWFNKDDGTFKGTNKDGPAVGFEESLRIVEKVWQEENCDGILGFSQGACFAGLICSLSARGMTPIKPEFAILSSGFKSGSLVHMNYYLNKNQIPSLHIFGQTDEIIPQEFSESLAETFIEPQILPHKGGHFFPAQSHLKQLYVEFFQDRLQEHLERQEIENASQANSLLVGGNGGAEDDDSD